MSDTQPLLVPLNEACTMLGLCRQTLYRMEKDNEIRFVRIRGRTLVPMSEMKRLSEPAPILDPVGVPERLHEKARPRKRKLYP